MKHLNQSCWGLGSLSEEMFTDIKSMKTPYENSQTAKERARLIRHSCESNVSKS
jgi:hypothetical protein